MTVLTDHPLAEVILLEPRRFDDERGYFQETYNDRRLAEAVGYPVAFVQDNESFSKRAGTVRGLHYQRPPYAQGKLVRVVAGAVIDVVVDVRPDSDTYLQHVAVKLTARGGDQLWVPPGMAHGFCTLTDNTVVSYKVTEHYRPEAEGCLHWLDPHLGIQWPIIEAEAIISDKDRKGLTVAEMEIDRA